MTSENRRLSFSESPQRPEDLLISLPSADLHEQAENYEVGSGGFLRPSLYIIFDSSPTKALISGLTGYTWQIFSPSLRRRHGQALSHPGRQSQSLRLPGPSRRKLGHSCTQTPTQRANLRLKIQIIRRKYYKIPSNLAPITPLRTFTPKHFKNC